MIRNYVIDVFHASLRPNIVAAYICALSFSLVAAMVFGIISLVEESSLTAKEITHYSNECEKEGLKPRLITHYSKGVITVTCEFHLE